MSPAADRSVRAALELLVQLPVAEDAPTLRRRAVRGIAALVPAELVCWIDREPTGALLAVTSEPADALTPVVLAALAADMPLAAVHRGLGHRLAISVPDPRTEASVALY